MKKIIILISIFCCLFVQAQEKSIASYKVVRVTSQILEDKMFSETIQDAEFKVADSIRIVSKDFEYYIDDDGAFTLPSITFTLNEGVKLFYEGKEVWENEGEKIEGYVFSSSKGQALMFIRKDSKKIVFSYLKDEEETYEISDNNLAINCKYHQTNTIIKIE